jgi:hypothetical protein
MENNILTTYKHNFNNYEDCEICKFCRKCNKSQIDCLTYRLYDYKCDGSKFINGKFEYDPLFKVKYKNRLCNHYEKSRNIEMVTLIDNYFDVRIINII